MAFTFCISETDARTKWCPMTRVGDQNLGGTSTRPDNSYGCIGSDCMAWRWVEANLPDGKGDTEPRYNTHGYCGLAGEPWRRK